MIRIASIALLAIAGGAQAQSTIYKCTDADGGTLISNNRVDKSCKAVVTGPDNAMKAPRAPSAAANPTPSSFPKVAEDQQKARDNDRKRILEQELAGEQKNLDQAKRELAEQEALKPATEDRQRGIDRLQPYKDRVAQHERNIAAINKELGGVK
ncbi:MAG TPA: DUF4124 domain-containing protein [Rhodocyclaceae bacterium]|nr:DUF4124 domain-containing protein [Rhodocyclaceae bacterium]